MWKWLTSNRFISEMKCFELRFLSVSRNCSGHVWNISCWNWTVQLSNKNYLNTKLNASRCPPEIENIFPISSILHSLSHLKSLQCRYMYENRVYMGGKILEVPYPINPQSYMFWFINIYFWKIVMHSVRRGYCYVIHLRPMCEPSVSSVPSLVSASQARAQSCRNHPHVDTQTYLV